MIERKYFFSKDYILFEEKLSKRDIEKIYFVLNMLKKVFPISSKFVKKLLNTSFYELRISTDKEIRIIIFPVDNENINLATNIIVLSGFIKKSNRDYKKAINKAHNNLRNIL